MRKNLKCYITGPGSMLNRETVIRPIMTGNYGNITLRQYRAAIKKLGGNNNSILKLIDNSGSVEIIVFRDVSPWSTIT